MRPHLREKCQLEKELYDPNERDKQQRLIHRNNLVKRLKTHNQCKTRTYLTITLTTKY